MANDLIIKIGATSDQFKEELKSVKKETETLQKGLSTVAKNGAIAFAALSAGIGAASKAFGDFQSKFSDVVTLLDKSSFKTKTFKQGVKDLQDGVIKLGASSGESFDKLNKGLFDIISAGVPAEKAISALKAATDLAIAGATDTAVAVDGLTSALNAYSLDADQAEEVSQKFFIAQKFGKTTVEELASGFGLVASSAAAFGVSLDELLAAVSAATTAGIRTNSAYTGLAAIFAGISKPTKEAQEEAARLGIEFNTTALRAQGLEGFLNNLTEANGFTQQSVERLFGSVEAQKIAFALTGNQADNFSSTLGELGNKASVTETFLQALKVKTEDQNKQFERIARQTQAFATKLGEQLAPAVGNVLGRVEEFTMKLANLSDENTKFIADLLKYGAAAAAAVTALATVSVALLSLRTAMVAVRSAALLMWAAVTSPIGAAAVAIGSVGVAAYKGVRSLQGKDGIGADFTRPEDKGEAGIVKSDGSEAGTDGFSTTPDRYKAEIAAQKAHLEEQARLEEEAAAREAEAKRIRDEEETTRRQEASQKAAEDLQRKLEQEEEAKIEAAEKEDEFNAIRAQIQAETETELNEAELEALRQHLGIKLSTYEEFEKKVQAMRKAEADKAKQDELRRQKQEQQATDKFYNDSISATSAFLGEQSAITKAFQIAETIRSTYAAAQSQFAVYSKSNPPLAYAMAAAAVAAGLGRVSQISKARQGGIVGGSGTGDSQHMLLEPGELVVPKSLVPNFAQVFGAGGGGGGAAAGGSVQVEIDITDDAAQIITARQRENTILGVT